jgi:hypothetical protein
LFEEAKIDPILNIRSCYGLAFALFTIMFSLFAQCILGLDARGRGYIQAYFGFLIALVQGVGVGMIAKRFKRNGSSLFPPSF